MATKMTTSARPIPKKSDPSLCAPGWSLVALGPPMMVTTDPGAVVVGPAWVVRMTFIDHYKIWLMAAWTSNARYSPRPADP
jgi:hypothetical protein